jgi:hypothetical protein
MGNSGSYRAEKHFKRFRHTFIRFIHQMITPQLRMLGRKEMLSAHRQTRPCHSGAGSSQRVSAMF